MDLPDSLKNNDLLDKAKSAAEKVQEQASHLYDKAESGVEKLRAQARDHRDDIDGALDSAQSFVDDKTKGKQAGTIGKVREFIGKGVDAVIGTTPEAGTHAEEGAPESDPESEPTTPVASAAGDTPTNEG